MARDPRTYLPTQIELVHPDTVSVRTLPDGSIEYRFAGKRRRPVRRVARAAERGPRVRGRHVPDQRRRAGAGDHRRRRGLRRRVFRRRAAPVGAAVLRRADRRGPGEDRQAAGVLTQQGREPLVLGGNWRYQTLSISPTDALLLDVLRYGREEVALLFDVPGELINAPAQGSSVTYANREQRTQDLLALRLGPAIARRERALSRLTVRGQWVKLNTAALLRADLAGRYASYQIGLRNGFLSFDDVADLEDREPLTAEQLQALHDAGILGAATPDDVKQPAAAGAGSTTTPQGVPA
jgi:hypothetical protein